MSSAHSSVVEASKPNSTHFLLRRLHSLTGILFGLYIVVHLVVNATMAQGQDPDVFQEQVKKIHSLPFLVVVEWLFIYIPILFHAVYGIWLTFAAQINVQNYPYGKNIYYTLQRISAMVIVGFLIFHVLSMKGVFGPTFAFEPHRATASTIKHINYNFAIAWIVYPLGILAATFHLANGFWTAGITWGLTVSKQGQRRWGFVCAGLFALTFGAGMTAWIAALVTKIQPHPIYFM